MNSDRTLNVALLSIDIAQNDPHANLEATETLLRKLNPGTDLVVLPELFSTGYCNSRDTISELAETVSGKTITRIKKWAASFNCAFAGSFLCRVGDSFFNRAFFIEPGGDETYYDKRHLFSLSHENTLYTPGISPFRTVRFRGWNISMIVCYDLRFPVWARNTGNLYDLLIVPANWGNTRQYAWQHLLIARAIENQAYVIGINRSGTDDYGTYDNTSLVIGPKGNILELPETNNIIQATLSLQKVLDIRAYLPALNDADHFSIDV
ncbi:MAG: nitrilase family protein [Muribaculaceae bacterium]|nr:nitrilase family protein [Muribaculaceae bacterium]